MTKGMEFMRNDESEELPRLNKSKRQMYYKVISQQYAEHLVPLK